jgi:hypothetical protein
MTSPRPSKTAMALMWMVLFLTRCVTAQQASTPQYARCDQLQSLLDQYSRTHDSCLAANQNAQSVPESAEVCSRPACQSYHVYVYGAEGRALKAEIDQCRQALKSAQTAADQQAQTDANRAGAYGQNAATSNQLADQYNNQAAQYQPYTMSDGTAQDINSLHAESLNTQSSGSDDIYGDSGTTISADSYSVSQSAPDQPEVYNQQDAQALLERGLSQTTAGQVVTDIQELRSGVGQKQLDGTFDLADKANDKFNPDSGSKYVVGKCLPLIHNVYSNAMSLLNSAGQDMRCITDPSCSGVGSATETRWNQIQHQPLQFFSPPAGENVFDQ